MILNEVEQEKWGLIGSLLGLGSVILSLIAAIIAVCLSYVDYLEALSVKD
ncbi:hypothetical protein [Bacillus sp. M6-12]|nr:hypothetical protein [Bacillus sp. M6-12]